MCIALLDNPHALHWRRAQEHQGNKRCISIFFCILKWIYWTSWSKLPPPCSSIEKLKPVEVGQGALRPWIFLSSVCSLCKKMDELRPLGGENRIFFFHLCFVSYRATAVWINTWLWAAAGRLHILKSRSKHKSFQQSKGGVICFCISSGSVINSIRQAEMMALWSCCGDI